METLVRDQIVSHMMENSLFCDEQHGFILGRSCMTQLLITIELWTELLDTGAQGWHVSSVDSKNRVSSITEEILSSPPFWEETKKW